MKTYVVAINYRIGNTYRVIAKDELNAIKEVTIRLMHECDNNIDDIDIQDVKELIDDDEL